MDYIAYRHSDPEPKVSAGRGIEVNKLLFRFSIFMSGAGKSSRLLKNYGVF